MTTETNTSPHRQKHHDLLTEFELLTARTSRLTQAAAAGPRYQEARPGFQTYNGPSVPHIQGLNSSSPSPVEEQEEKLKQPNLQLDRRILLDLDIPESDKRRNIYVPSSPQELDQEEDNFDASLSVPRAPDFEAYSDKQRRYHPYGQQENNNKHTNNANSTHDNAPYAADVRKSSKSSSKSASNIRSNSIGGPSSSSTSLSLSKKALPPPPSGSPSGSSSEDQNVTKNSTKSSKKDQQSKVKTSSLARKPSKLGQYRFFSDPLVKKKPVVAAVGTLWSPAALNPALPPSRPYQTSYISNNSNLGIISSTTDNTAAASSGGSNTHLPSHSSGSSPHLHRHKTKRKSSKSRRDISSASASAIAIATANHSHHHHHHHNHSYSYSHSHRRSSRTGHLHSTSTSHISRRPSHRRTNPDRIDRMDPKSGSSRPVDASLALVSGLSSNSASASSSSLSHQLRLKSTSQNSHLSAGNSFESLGSSLMSSSSSKDSKTASTDHHHHNNNDNSNDWKPTTSLKNYHWPVLKSKLKEAMLAVSHSTQVLPVSWLSLETQKWVHGLCIIDQAGTLRLVVNTTKKSDQDQLQTGIIMSNLDPDNMEKLAKTLLSSQDSAIVVPDLRECSFRASPAKGYMELDTKKMITGTQHSRIFLGSGTENDYIKLCAILLLWTNLKPSGMRSKSYTPSVVVVKDTHQSNPLKPSSQVSLADPEDPKNDRKDVASPQTPPAVRQIKVSQSMASMTSVTSSPGDKNLAHRNQPSGLATPATPDTDNDVSGYLTGSRLSPEVLRYSLSQKSEETLGDSYMKSKGDASDLDDLLVSHCKAYIPSLKSTAAKRIESASDPNHHQPGSAFKLGDSWTTVTCILSKYGLLQVLDEDTGHVLLEAEIHRIVSSKVQLIDYSLFESPYVIYIDVTGGLLSTTSTRSTAPKDAVIVYLQLSTDEQFEDWFSSLKAFTRKQIFAPTTGDVTKALRVTQKLKLSVMEGKIEGDVANTSSGSSSVLGSDDENDYFPFLNSYVEVSFANRAWCRTHVSWGKKDPIWRDTFTFENLPNDLPTMKLSVKRRLGSRVSPAVDPVIGHVLLDDTQLKKALNGVAWYDVIKGVNLNKRDITPTASSSSTATSDHINSMKDSKLKIRLSISFEETLVLSGEHYSELEELLDDIPNRAAVIMASSLNNIAEVSDLCLRYYLTKNLAIPWLMDLIDLEASKIGSQVEASAEGVRKNIENTLFRGNSLLSKSMEAFMRIVGEDYLDKVIGTFVKKLVENRAFLEIDPERIVNTAQFIAAKGKKPLDTFLEENRKKLKQYMQFLWALIRNSLDDMPFSFKLLFSHLRRSVCRHILVSSSQKLNDDVESSSVVNNSISGFLFLRFFCPAILNPKLFKLVRSQPTPQIQRSLTLIAKITQGFANRVTFGNKEPWMMPMNEFMAENQTKLNNFFAQLSLRNVDEKALAERLVFVSTDGQLDVSRFEERPLKQCPVELPMSDRLSDPYLFDRYECLQKLVDVWIKSKGDASIGSLSVEELTIAKVMAVINQSKVDITSGLTQPERIKTNDIRQLVDNTKMNYNDDTGLISLLSGASLSDDPVLFTGKDDKPTTTTVLTPGINGGSPLNPVDSGDNGAASTGSGTKDESPSKKSRWSTKFLRLKS